jgi:hypothetical protein
MRVICQWETRASTPKAVKSAQHSAGEVASADTADAPTDLKEHSGCTHLLMDETARLPYGYVIC